MFEMKLYDGIKLMHHFKRRYAGCVFGVYFIALLVSGCASNPIKPINMDATPLQAAAGQADAASGYLPRTPDLQKVKLLVESGADVNETNLWGSALHSAVRSAELSGKQDIVEYLLSHGADVNAKANYDDTPLMVAAAAGNFDMVKLLVEKGADLNTVSSVNGLSPLAEAAYSGRYEIVTYLINKGANISLQADAAYIRGAEGMALHIKGDNQEKPAASNGRGKSAIPLEHTKILKLLVSKGANVNSVDGSGWNALHHAAHHGSLKATRYLLKAGVNPNVRGRIGTPLAVARFSREQSAQSLVNRPGGMSDKAWANYSKYLRESIPEFDSVIGVLTPLTRAQAATVARAAGRPQLAVAGSRAPAAAQETQEREPTLVDQAVDTVADCIKLKASLKACDAMPWPASSLCSSTAKSNYSSIVCNQ